MLWSYSGQWLHNYMVVVQLKSVIWQANDVALSWGFYSGDTEQVIQLL